MAMDGRVWVKIVQAMAEAVRNRQDQLSDLDSTVGDGDHGVNLARALDEAARQAAALSAPGPEGVLRTAGLAVQDGLGGASGILFGAFFLGMSAASAGKPSTTLSDVAEMLAAGLTEVQRRGKAGPGDKTMVDALALAVAAARTAAAQGQSLADGARHIAAAARLGAGSTQTMRARFGRAKFLGERSLGHQDAGATSISIMLSALARTLRGGFGWKS